MSYVLPNPERAALWGSDLAQSIVQPVLDGRAADTYAALPQTPSGMAPLAALARNGAFSQGSAAAPVASGAPARSAPVGDAGYLRYANQGATRNQPLSDELASALGFLPEIGVTAEVFSGGQPAKGSGGARVGSTRHDHGNAADVRFYRDGRALDWANDQDRPYFEEIVRRGRAAGLTGFGAGPGYMGQGTMHVGFGSPGVWGAGGRSANAPDWLRNAYYGGGGAAPAGVQVASADGSGPSAETMDALMSGVNTSRASRGEPPMQVPGSMARALSGYQGMDVGGLIQSIAAGETTGPSLTREQFLSLLQNDATRPIAGELMKQRVGGDPGAGERALKLALDLDQQNYDRSRDALGDRRWEREFEQTERLAQMRSSGGGGTEYGLTPQYGVDANGNPVVIQLAKDGTSIQTPLPEGVSLSREPIRLDAGTEWVILDPITRQPVGRVPKDNFNEARDTALGTEAGKTEAGQIADAPATFRQSGQMLASIDGILNDPYLGWATGAGGGFLSSLPGTPMRGIRARIDQLGGQAFLQAFESLKGGGAITEIEGLKATQAIARLDQAQSEADYRTALNDLRTVVSDAMQRAERQMQNPPRTSAGQPARAPTAPSAPAVDFSTMSDEDLEAIANGR